VGLDPAPQVVTVHPAAVEVRATAHPAKRAARPVAGVTVGLFLLAAVPVIPGKLLLVEVACALALPWLLPTFVSDRRLGIPVLLVGGWGLGLITADITNGSGVHPSHHLLAAFTVVTLTAALLRLSDGDPTRLRMLVVAVAIGVAIAGLTAGSGGPTSAAYPHGPPPSLPILWKYKLAVPVTIATIAFLDIRWRSGARSQMFAALAVLVAVNIVADFRMLAVLTTCTLAVYAIATAPRARLRPSAVSITGAIACVLLVAGFFAAARSGWLGARSANQFRGDSVNAFTIMANVRPEGLQAVYLISERPLGYGSQPRLDGETFARSLTFIQQHGVVVHVNLPKDWLVKATPGLAAHSMALDTAVQAGVLALPFWFFVLIAGIRRAVSAVRSRASPLLLLWTLIVVWNAVFEPMSWPNHVLLTAYVALVLMPLPTPVEESR
jgi:hypothetical protein